MIITDASEYEAKVANNVSDEELEKIMEEKHSDSTEEAIKEGAQLESQPPTA